MATMISSTLCEMRFDPINERAVLIAPARAKRPLAPEDCPGCISALTPPAVYAHPPGVDPDGEKWDVRVVPNKFSCFSDLGGNRRCELSPGFKSIQDPAGRSEVVFETKKHDHPVYARTSEEIVPLFQALVSRYESAQSDPCAKYWIAFKNLGKPAGCSLEHEHWQLYTLPFIPPSIQERYARAAQHFERTGQNLYCSVFDREARLGERVVAQSEHFLTFVPWASAMPYETWICPRRAAADFSAMTDDEMLDLATSFRDAVSRLNSVHPDLPFNVLLHTAAFEHALAPWFTWHLSILPRITTIAGIELGTDLMINPVNPEAAASELRSIPIQ